MANKKQRENYGNGSVTAVMVDKLADDGSPVIGSDGKRVRVQKKDSRGRLAYRVAITLGTETVIDKNGNERKRQRKVQKVVYVSSLKEARAEAKRMTDDYSKVELDVARGSFSELCKVWHDEKPHKCSARQLDQYMRLLGYMSVVLDKKPLVELRKQDVRDALKSLDKSRGLSASTRNKALAITKSVFEFALDNDYIVKNPCRGIDKDVPTDARPRRALSEHDAALLRARLDTAEEKAYASFTGKESRQGERGNTFGRSCLRGLSDISNVLVVRLLLATGMRRGEGLALTWGNVDLVRGTVRVCQTFTEACELKKPKTDYGIRNMYVDSHTIAHLRKWKAFQKKALHLIQTDEGTMTQTDDTPVFVTDAGTMIDPTNCYRWWAEFRGSIGFEGLLLHELRHSHVTMLLGNLIPIDMVQTRVGHMRPSTVTSVYTHELPARDQQAAELTGRILYETDISGEGELVGFRKLA